MTEYTPGESAFGGYQEQLELAEGALESALFFAGFSLTAYSTGKLQHATDARSKAEILYAMAATRLTASVMWDSVEPPLDKVRIALARLTHID
jgi:hypothetical protein